MSSVNQETEAGLRKLKTGLLVARVFGMLALLGWISAFLYYQLGLAVEVTGAARVATSQTGALFLVPSALNALVLWRIGQIRAATIRKDIGGLKKLVSPDWAALTLLVSAVIPGVILIVSGAQASLGWAALTLLVSAVIPGVVLVLLGGQIGRMKQPELPPSGAVFEVSHLTKYFPVRRTFSQSVRRGKGGLVHAVEDVSFKIRRGEIFGLAGESGSGKTTVLRTALMLTEPTSGSVVYNGMEISRMGRGELKKHRTKIQAVFQDPYESVNPRMSVFDIISEGLYVNHLVSSRAEAEERVIRSLREVQITPPEDYLHRFPHELSGGQRQRVAIARAIILDPAVILADEPVSMLDVSIRAEVINVLLAIREKRGVAVLMVTHDLALAKDMVDKLAIMYLGKIVESGPAEEVVATPFHPYTHALTAAVPVPDPLAPKVKVLAKGEIPTNISPPSGCRFHPRCPFAKEICSEEEPPLEEVLPGHSVACHFWKEARDAYSRGLDGPVGSNVEA